MNGRWDLDLPPLAANRITVCRGQLCWGSSWMIKWAPSSYKWCYFTPINGQKTNGFAWGYFTLICSEVKALLGRPWYLGSMDYNPYKGR